MTIIKNWQPTENSVEWENVVGEAEGPDTTIPPGRLFILDRPMTADEFLPLGDLEEALTCELTYDGLVLVVDAPLIRIVHHYLNTLE